MLNKELETALNKQMNLELWSGYLYFSMSYDMRRKEFCGIANWFENQAREEVEHAQTIGAHILNMNGKVHLVPIAEVRQEWASPKEAFEDTLMHEKQVTVFINKLYEKAVELKQYPTMLMLEWFITEQVNEEEKPRSYLDVLKKIGDDKSALYMFDSQIGKLIKK